MKVEIVISEQIIAEVLREFGDKFAWPHARLPQAEGTTRKLGEIATPTEQLQVVASGRNNPCILRPADCRQVVSSIPHLLVPHLPQYRCCGRPSFCNAGARQRTESLAEVLVTTNFPASPAGLLIGSVSSPESPRALRSSSLGTTVQKNPNTLDGKMRDRSTYPALGFVYPDLPHFNFG
jgi:hypothetical protein